jgi:hypothetical protein
MSSSPPNAPLVAVADQRSPQGFGPCVTLLADRLILESRGALGGGLRDDIPLAAIQGFYAVTYQHKDLTGGDVGQSFDQFLVAWMQPSGKRRVTKWMIDTRSPPFQALLQELARIRPDASLLHLPSNQAHKALGVRSLQQIQVLVVVVVLLGTLLAVALVIGAVVMMR